MLTLDGPAAPGAKRPWLRLVVRVAPGRRRGCVPAKWHLGPASQPIAITRREAFASSSPAPTASRLGGLRGRAGCPVPGNVRQRRGKLRYPVDSC